MGIIFQDRYELKFVEHYSKCNKFIEILEHFLIPEPEYEQGYLVNSVYFDNKNFKAFYDKVDGVDPRCKIRLRWYQTDSLVNLSSNAFLEIKRKHGELIKKSRSSIATDFALDLLSAPKLGITTLANLITDHESSAALVSYFGLNSILHPTCRIQYFRRPFIASRYPNVKVTIDSSLQSAAWHMDLSKQPNLSFLSAHERILEIKCSVGLPLEMVDAIKSAKLYLNRYSKYCSGLAAINPKLLTNPKHSVVRSTTTFR